MSQSSDRFKALKDEYEKMVEREYPGWLQQLASIQKLKEQNEVRNKILRVLCSSLGSFLDAPSQMNGVQHNYPNTKKDES